MTSILVFMLGHDEETRPATRRWKEVVLRWWVTNGSIGDRTTCFERLQAFIFEKKLKGPIPVALMFSEDKGVLISSHGADRTVGRGFRPCRCGRWVEKAAVCSRCCRQFYCSEKCQKEHWKAHKVVCGPISDDDRKDLRPTEEREATQWPISFATCYFVGADGRRFIPSMHEFNTPTPALYKLTLSEGLAASIFAKYMPAPEFLVTREGVVAAARDADTFDLSPFGLPHGEAMDEITATIRKMHMLLNYVDECRDAWRIQQLQREGHPVVHLRMEDIVREFGPKE